MSIKLIVGLGNPGSQYANTRHNAGAWFVEALANQNSLSLKSEKKFCGAYAKWSSSNGDCYLLIPDTFMNLSGQAVQALANFYKIEKNEILIVHDELDIPPGEARLKLGGGLAGHNGLKDIAQKLSTKDFMRLRIGIGRPQYEGSDHVLSKPSLDEKIMIDRIIDQAIDCLPLLQQDEFERAMKQLHTSTEG